MRETLLILFCKRPRLGYSKQRLAEAIGSARAYAIAEALLACALDDVRMWDGPFMVSPSSADDTEWFRQTWSNLFGGAHAHLVPQGTGNLGERLADISQHAASTGFARQLFIGSDAPLLTPSDMQTSAHALDDADVSLAHSSDGGVTMMGCRRGWPELAALPWSTERLGRALADACTASGRTLFECDGGRDLDTAGDMAPLAGALAADTRPERVALRALLRAELDAL